MTIKSLGNTLATFKDIFGRTGNRAYRDFVPFSVTSSGTIATPASGLAPGNGYVYHTFTGPGTFTVSGSSGTVEVFAVGAGGAGGNSGGGGGGAGGLVYATDVSITAGSYSISVGSGGTGFVQPNPSWPEAQNGGDTTFGTSPSPTYLIAKGGGAGTPMGGSVFPGGSGSGGSRNNAPGGTGTQPSQNPGFSNGTLNQYGNNGGASTAGFFPGGGAGGGGGGGAGGTGTVSSGPGNGSNGGVGRQYPNFTGPLIGVPSLAPLSGYFAGGGSGGNDGGVVAGGLGGGAPGGSGGPNFGSNTPGGNGVTNSGGGGGGAGSGPGTSGNSGNGGPGIVIIRYLA